MASAKGCNHSSFLRILSAGVGSAVAFVSVETFFAVLVSAFFVEVLFFVVALASTLLLLIFSAMDILI